MADTKQQHRREVLTWVQIARVAHKMELRLNAELARHNLTLAQFEVLFFLDARPGMTQQDLAAELLVSKGNVCGLINRLTDGGLVERHNHPEDKRSYQLFLSAAGESALKDALPLHDSVVKDVITALAEKERALMSKFLMRIDDNF